MNIEFPSFTILLLLIPFSLLLLKLVNIFITKKKTSSKLPPGPWKLPLIGNIHQLAFGLPHQVLRNLSKKHGPLMHLQLGELSVVVISSPETAKQIMKTHDIIFATRPQILAATIMSTESTSITFSPYGEYWKQLRKICAVELLSVKRVQSFHAIREEDCLDLVKWIVSNEGSTINLTEKVLSTTFNIVSRAAFGKKNKESEILISIIRELSVLISGFNIAEVFPSIKFLHHINGIIPKLAKLDLQIDRVVEKMIMEHKAKKSSNAVDDEGEIHEDLLDVLLNYHDKETDFSLTADNIKAVIMDIFGAGAETSATTVDWAICEMIKNPNILKKTQDEVRQVFNNKGYVTEANLYELKYLKAVIKETLRLHPAAPLLLPRECREACEINGYAIPVKTKVIVNAWAINRDSGYWEDPECFKPERFLNSSVEYKGTNFEYIPFGAGRRICPGMTFGLANVELPLAKLLYHLDWKLPNGMKNEELDMTEIFGVTTRRKDDLHVIPVVYEP